MEIKSAIELVSASINETAGPGNMFDSFKEQISEDLRIFENYEAWEKRLNSRTDISDDDRWDIQCITETIRVCFELRGPKA